MNRRIRRFAVSGLAALVLVSGSPERGSAADTRWKTIRNEEELRGYTFEAFSSPGSGYFYPTSVRCRRRGGALQVKFDVLPAGPDKPYHKWSATLQRPGETQAEAAARLPIRGFPEVKYRIKFGCKAAGKTVLVAFRGDRKLD